MHRAVPCLDLGALFGISIMAFGSPTLHSWESLALAAPGGNHTSSMETLVNLVEMQVAEAGAKAYFSPLRLSTFALSKQSGFVQRVLDLSAHRQFTTG